MPDFQKIPGSCEDWLRYAKADLALARMPLPDGAMYESLTFHAQQAAEKAIKAVYIKQGMRFRYTHDIGELLSGLIGASLVLNEDIKAATNLSTYAWEARYPCLDEPVTEEESREAAHLAERVVTWAEKLIRPDDSLQTDKADIVDVQGA